MNNAERKQQEIKAQQFVERLGLGNKFTLLDVIKKVEEARHTQIEIKGFSDLPVSSFSFLAKGENGKPNYYLVGFLQSGLYTGYYRLFIIAHQLIHILRSDKGTNAQALDALDVETALKTITSKQRESQNLICIRGGEKAPGDEPAEAETELTTKYLMEKVSGFGFDPKASINGIFKILRTVTKRG